MINMPSQQEANILEQSFKFLTRDGFRSFTVDSLAQKLGMSKKTIYQFFPTKEVLIEKSVDFFTQILEEKFRTIMEKEPNPVKQFMNIMQFIIGQVSRIPMEKVADMKIRYPKIWKKIEAFRLARRNDFYSILCEAQKQGYVRKNIDVKIAATLYMNIINSTFQPEFFIRNNLVATDTIHMFLKMITGGLFTQEGLEFVEDI